MNHRILVVDDEVDICDVLKESLSEEGYDVQTCLSGYDAITHIESTKYDFVVTDYSMKDGDGVSLAHYCCNRDIGCVVVTAYESESVRGYLPDNVQVFDKFVAVDLSNFKVFLREQIRSK